MAVGRMAKRVVVSMALVSALGAGTLSAQTRGGGRGAGSSQPPDISLALGYAADGFLQANGGQPNNAVALDNLDFLLHLNLKALPGLRGTSIRVHVQSNRGGLVSPGVGALQGISNLEAEEGWRLYEAWIEHQVRWPRLSFLAGIYDINSEFDAIPSAGDFLNSAFGFGPDYGLSGVNGPSTYPSTGLAARVMIQPAPSFFGLLAVSDAVPGNSNTPRFSLDAQEGALFSFEMGYAQPRVGIIPGRGMGRRRVGRGRPIEDVSTKVALGGWFYSQRFPQWGSDPSSAYSWGTYLLAERLLHQNRNGIGELSAFGRLGYATGETNQLDLTLRGGLVYRGPIPSHPGDQVGVGVAYAHNGSPFLREERRVGRILKGHETVVELMYRAEMGPLLVIQPDIQWVVNPGMDSQRTRTILFGLRGHLLLEYPG